MESLDAKSAFFEFDTLPDPETFTVKLTDPEKIAHARGLLSGKVTSKPHISGTIVKKRARYNSHWLFHLAPESIHFFEMATEVCDATIRYVADHLDEVGGAFLPKNQWCPWASRLVREVQPAMEQQAGE
jgi:hypothetical protein